MLAQDPARVGAIAVVIPRQGALAVVVVQPGPAERLDAGELTDGRVGALDVVRPVVLARRDLVVERPKLGLLGRRRPVAQRDDPVAVAVLVARSERERPLDIRPDQVLTEDPPPCGEELGEQCVQIGVRRPGGGRGHDERVGRVGRQE